MKRKRARAAKGSALGRVFEVLADLALILVILAFGVSIAARYNPEKADTREARPGRVPHGSGVEARPEAASVLPDPVRRPSGRSEGGDAGAHVADHAGGAGGRKTDDEGAAASTRTAGAPARGAAPRYKLTVDIRNGCGRVGLAEDMMHAVRRAGFDVVEYRNADRYDYPKTEIRDRAGNSQVAALRDWMRREYGVGDVVKDPGKSAGADVQLVLGSDLADTLRRRERAER